MGGDELPELREGRVDVVLAPALPGVGEHLPGHGAEHRHGGKTQIFLETWFKMTVLHT